MFSQKKKRQKWMQCLQRELSYNRRGLEPNSGRSLCWEEIPGKRGPVLWQSELRHHLQHSWSPGCSTSNSALANAPGKSVEDGPSMWAPATHVGDSDGVPGSWLWTDPACPLQPSGEWTRGWKILSLSLSLRLSLSLSPSLSHTAFQIKKILF